MERNVYLSNTSLEEAREMLLSDLFIKKRDTEVIETISSVGRITAEPIYSVISAPHYNCSAMDGIAVDSELTAGADERNPITLINGRDFKIVDTGDVIEDKFDSVIMVEYIKELENGDVQIFESAYPWQNIRPIGEDIVQNEMVLPGGHKIRPMDLGALIASGVRTVNVIKKPIVAVIPTGTEVVDWNAEPKAGDILDSNSWVFSEKIRELGGNPLRYDPTPDDYKLLVSRVKEAASASDLVIINAGSSAGTEDFTSKIVSELGELYTHGVAIKPGKPTIIGRIGNASVLGIPGYPVSAYMVFEEFAAAWIKEYLGCRAVDQTIQNAVLSRRVVSSLKHEEYVRVKLGKVGDKLIATPLNRGAGVTMSLVKADGIMIIPRSIEVVEEGSNVEIRLIRTLEEISGSVVSIGSHDPLVDVLGSILKHKGGGYNLSSTHVGSMGGVMAVRRGETHLAPIHLLDQDSGEYNIPFAKKYLSGRNIGLIRGIKRVQGLMIQRGNPKNITDLTDLVRDDISFVNRQKGSGTRLLLDYKLKGLEIGQNSIKGYKREMSTHMSVASSVKSGSADVGVGIESAAMLLGLDFIPIGEESYEFIFDKDLVSDDIIDSIIDVLSSDEFKSKLDELGGYKIDGDFEIISV